MRLVNGLVAAVVAVLAVASPAFAQEAAVNFNGLAAGLGLAIAAAGGAYGQGRIIAAALESISRNPGAAGQLRLPWLLGCVFVESLVIYAFVIALKLA